MVVMKIRLATPQDSDRLLAIYSQYIGHLRDIRV